jgi:hypothetical protein
MREGVARVTEARRARRAWRDEGAREGAALTANDSRRTATKRFMIMYMPTTTTATKKYEHHEPVTGIASFIGSYHAPVMMMKIVSIAGPK